MDRLKPVYEQLGGGERLTKRQTFIQFDYIKDGDGERERERYRFNLIFLYALGFPDLGFPNGRHLERGRFSERVG